MSFVYIADIVCMFHNVYCLASSGDQVDLLGEHHDRKTNDENTVDEFDEMKFSSHHRLHSQLSSKWNLPFRVFDQMRSRSYFTLPFLLLSGRVICYPSSRRNITIQINSDENVCCLSGQSVCVGTIFPTSTDENMYAEFIRNVRQSTIYIIFHGRSWKYRWSMTANMKSVR